MTHHADAERAEFEAWAQSQWRGINLAWMSDFSKYADFGTNTKWLTWQAARRDPAVPVPQFSRIAQKKLDYLLEAGEAITGYAIENKDGRRGAIDCHGFVYWWQDAAAPQPPVPQVTPEMIEAAEEAYMPFGDMGLAIQCALSAAPQLPACNPSMQPELATYSEPVQMPEPAAWVYSFIHSSATGKPDLRVDSITTDRDRAYSEGHSDQFALYSEQQVRQLLAAHGIRKDKA